MSTGPPAEGVGRDFFERDPLAVAADLVGATLVVDGGEVVCRLVEVEAYGGRDDPASHSYRGPTPRSAIMFAEPGHLYVYLSYGIHRCANLVTSPAGTAGAVLLRAAAVTSGAELVRRRRGAPSDADADALLRGPGNLCAGLGIGGEDNGLDVCADGARLRLLAAPSGEPVPIARGPRIGISRAIEQPHRLWWAGHPAVSHARSGAATRPSRRP